MSFVTYGLTEPGPVVDYGLGYGVTLPVYVMRAYHMVLPARYVYWTVEEVPDELAAKSGLPFEELSDIVIFRYFPPLDDTPFGQPPPPPPPPTEVVPPSFFGIMFPPPGPAMGD